MRGGILVWNANPTLDVVSEVTRMDAGEVHRADTQAISAGGKGTLLVRALTILGTDCLGLAPVAGPTGTLVAQLFREEQLPFEVTEVSGHTRAAVSIVDRHRTTDTVVNGPGPETHDGRWRAHVTSLVRYVESGAFGMLVIAGRPPLGTAMSDLLGVCNTASSCGVRVVLDLASPMLEVAATTDPWFIKVNLQESRTALARVAKTDGDDPVLGLQRLGARNVVLTDGPNAVRGHLLGKAFMVRPPIVEVRSAVGCGDCFLAGMLHGLTLAPDDPDESLLWGLAVGAAAAETLQPGRFSLARAAQLRALYKQAEPRAQPS